MLKRALLAVALFISACGGGITHTKVIDPTVLAKVPGLGALGPLTSMRATPTAIYVAGQTGLCAISPDGKMIWTLELPAALERMIEVDAAGIAITSFDLVGVEAAEGLKAFILGNAGDKPTFAHQALAYASLGGKLLWTVPAAGEAPMSAPGLSADGIGVSRGDNLYVYARANGAEIFHAPLCTDTSGGEGANLQASFNRPVFANGGWYAAHLNYFTKFDASGKVVNASRGFGLFTPFQNITAGPIAVRDTVVFGNAPWGKDKPLVMAADKDGDKSWKEQINDKGSGVGSLATNDTQLFAATNFQLSAFSLDGSSQWSVANKKGGLYPGSQRGLRYIGNAFASTFAVRKSQTQQMVADQRRVYVTSLLDSGDVITVLDAATGQYIDTLTTNQHVVEMALTSNALVLATDEGVELIALQ